MQIPNEIFNKIKEELTEKLKKCKTKEDFKKEFPTLSKNDPYYWIYEAFEKFDEMRQITEKCLSKEYNNEIDKIFENKELINFMSNSYINEQKLSDDDKYIEWLKKNKLSNTYDNYIAWLEDDLPE